MTLHPSLTSRHTAVPLIIIAGLLLAVAVAVQAAPPLGVTVTGTGALQVDTGNYNTGDGFDALNHNTSGTYDTAVGAYSLLSNTGGSQNTAVGVQRAQIQHRRRQQQRHGIQRADGQHDGVK